MNNNINTELLIFDDKSPLFIKRKAKKVVVRKNINKTTHNYIKHPDDCKHILAAFRSKLLKAWKLLEGDNIIKAAGVPNYINGVAIVAKIKRPKEYAELKELVKVAKEIINKRNV